jgi:hypothetical protein
MRLRIHLLVPARLMTRLAMPWRVACGVLATALLASCGLRLPVEKQAIRRIEVHLDAPETVTTKNDPDLLIWLVSDSYHTGLVFPYDWLLESGYVPPAKFGHPRYVTMSWGNRDAYSRDGFDNPWKVFRVLFTPTRSVMELIPVDWDVAEVMPQHRIWRKLVPRDRGPAIAAFLNGCSQTDTEGRPLVFCESSWGKGVQLQSRHSYFIPRICNVWTVQAIETLGGKFNPWFGLTAGGLIRQAEKPPNNFELIWPGEKPES